MKGHVHYSDPTVTINYTFSLHDALPISTRGEAVPLAPEGARGAAERGAGGRGRLRRGDAPRTAAVDSATRALELDRKSTRLNSSHSSNSYAVFCLKKILV